MDDGWTLDELTERVGEALAADAVRAPNGRVRDLPDARAIRWYATIGLVDRPLPGPGRGVRYGARHLLQLVAIKRRQAQGRTLAQIQAELAGATDETLRRIARLPGELADATSPTRRESQPAGVSPAGPAPQSVPQGSPPRRARFWAEPARAASGGEPSPSMAADSGPSAATGSGRSPAAGAAGSASAELDPAASVEPEPGARDESSASAEPRQAVPELSLMPLRPRQAEPRAEPAVAVRYQIDLPGGATLGLPYPPSGADLAALRPAAAALVAALAERGLLDPEPPGTAVPWPAVESPPLFEGDAE